MSIVSTEVSTITDTTTTTEIIMDTVTDTITDTITKIITDTVTNTTTDITTDSVTDTATVTTTDTNFDTIIVPTTITAAPNPCPTTCSITSPSVYMVINTIYGYNTAGRTGPSGTSVVFPLDLNQVSTIDTVNSATRQLTLNDLGTDCPQSEDPSVIATAAPNGRCDPILVAPETVKSWASPCNACGNFGLFDPPYAVAPLTGGLVPATTTVAMTQPETTSSTVSTTDTTTTVSVTSESTSSNSETSSPVKASSPSSVVTTSSNTEGSFAPLPTPVSSSSDRASAASSSSSISISTSATTSSMYNTATKPTGCGGWSGLSFFILGFLL
ncbi:hypothetical protein N7466_008323 [Penicillium verhagenii]|uniref:uncharacterized protein n=1 Tax=Penicillium verhagenii TaxID=1562060 RepID=UPI0025450A99|nr:uncharacterized protein N7466_008323 [Penicillium verhagenii]KAJ5924136.1 hypothetical protein N7466_008323 [Penicillium verhagenii]